DEHHGYLRGRTGTRPRPLERQRLRPGRAALGPPDRGARRRPRLPADRQLAGIARRAAALGSLGLATGCTALAIVLAIERFPRGIAVLGCLVVALWAGWIALRGDGVGRLVAGSIAAGAVTAAIRGPCVSRGGPS